MELVSEEGRGSQKIKKVKESCGHISAQTGIGIANIYPALSTCMCVSGVGNKRGKVKISRQGQAM